MSGYQCEECGATFDSFYSLTQHNDATGCVPSSSELGRQHPMSCHKCGKEFDDDSSMMQHLEVCNE